MERGTIEFLTLNISVASCWFLLYSPDCQGLGVVEEHRSGQ